MPLALHDIWIPKLGPSHSTAAHRCVTFQYLDVVDGSCCCMLLHQIRGFPADLAKSGTYLP